MIYFIGIEYIRPKSNVILLIRFLRLGLDTVELRMFYLEKY